MADLFGGAKVAPQVSAPMSGEARNASLLERLRPRKSSERRMPAILALEANKGLKTVAALGVKLAAGKSVKGTPIVDTPGLPIPDGPVSVISFDNQTEGSLQSYYGDTQAEINKAEMYPIRAMLGFNSGRPKTAIDVVDGLRALLGSWATEKRAMIVMDRWDEYTENMVKLLCYAKAGLPADAALVERGVWNPRKAIIYETIDLLIGATMDDGVIILTGSEEKDEGAMQVTIVNGKTVVAKVPTKWASRVEMYLSARIGGTVGTNDRTGETVRFLTSHYSRYPAIPENMRVPINGRHIGAFQDASCLIPLGHPEPAPLVPNILPKPKVN